MLQVIHPLKEKSPVSDSHLEEHYGHEMMTWQKRVDDVVETPLRPRIGLHRPLADPLQSSWIWTQGWSVLRECLQRKRPAERGEDLDIFYRLMQKPPRVAEDTGVWSRSRETHINTECFLSVCVFICGWTFVIAVCGVRFLVQGFKKNGESSGVCVCVCVRAARVETQIGGGRSGTVWSKALQGHEWFNGRRGELRPPASQDAHRHLRPAEVIHSRDPANCCIDILHKSDFFGFYLWWCALICSSTNGTTRPAFCRSLSKASESSLLRSCVDVSVAHSQRRLM